MRRTLIKSCLFIASLFACFSCSPLTHDTIVFNNNLVELKDKDILDIISSYSESAVQDIMGPPSLDNVWAEYQFYKQYVSQYEYSFAYETKLISDSFFTCYYLSAETINKIESYIVNSLQYPEKDINYLYYYKMLSNDNKLTDEDKIMVKDSYIENPNVDKKIDNYQLVKITRKIRVKNSVFGGSFLDCLSFEEKNGQIFVDVNGISNRYNSKTIFLYNAHNLKRVFQNNLYPSGWLDICSYQINTKTNAFSTYIGYKQSVLEDNPDYYRQLDNVIIEKTFLQTDGYFDENNTMQKINWYEVICNYKKVKKLFKS